MGQSGDLVTACSGCSGLGQHQSAEECIPAPAPSQVGSLQGASVMVLGGAAFGNNRHQSAMSWLEEANFQMLRDHQCGLVWVDAWAFGCNSLKIQALEACCNHSYKHRSIERTSSIPQHSDR